METLFDLLRHLVAHGPARNESELAEHLAVIDKAEGKTADGGHEQEGTAK